MHFEKVCRRDFLIVFGMGAVLTGASAQSSKPVVGFVHARSREDTVRIMSGFQRGLAEGGFVQGQNVAIELRFADGHYNELPQMISDLLSRQVDVLVAGSDPAAVAAKHEAGGIPLVFVIGGDPVTLGLVKSLNRPGSNTTGMTILTTALEPKRLSLLRELLSTNATVGVFLNPKLPLSQKQSQEVQDAARAIDLSAKIFWAGSDAEIESALNALEQQRIAALMVGTDPFFDTRRQMFAEWAIVHKLPTMFQFREYASAGGLMSYGIDLPEVYRQVGSYTARILNGEKPSELPVLQPTKFELVLNLKTAKALGVVFPAGILAIADEVIEE